MEYSCLHFLVLYMNINLLTGSEMLQHKRWFDYEKNPSNIKPNHVSIRQNSAITVQLTGIVLRPDKGGVKGTMIPLYANHFLVRFDPSQKILHYNVEISPRPSKETARMIKNKLVEENSSALSGALPAFDGRKNLFSPIEFQQGKLEFFVSLPVASARLVAAQENGHMIDKQKHKIFRVNLRLVSKLSGEDLTKYFNEEKCGIPLPQDYLHALDIILREGSMESSIPVGRSLYSRSMGDARKIGGGAVGLSGFFQRLRPTKQGLALNVDLSITAFHESIGVIAYLQKRCEFLKGLTQMKTRPLTKDERREVEKALKNIRVFVCHRQSDQRYDVRGLTQETTENLKFHDRSGRDYMVVDYFKEHYNHDIQFRHLPCLQIGRRKPCYVPMELCMICEGQKFLGKLSDEQTSKMLNMGCRGPNERKRIIKGVVEGAFAAKRYTNLMFMLCLCFVTVIYLIQFY
jgi:eukaryotic translation initiation factor 2C